MSNLVYSYFCLDILHIGHIMHIKKSKEIAGMGGELIMGILTDEAIISKKKRPILSFSERFEIARSLKYADKVVPQETYSPLSNIKLYKPNILMESTSHSKKSIEELVEYMGTICGKVVINPYYKGQSSTKIKNIIKDRY